MNTNLDFKTFPWHSFVFVISTIALILMGIIAFYAPPKGEISESVFKYGCLFVAVIFISQIKPVMREAKSLKMQKGDLTIEAQGKENND